MKYKLSTLRDVFNQIPEDKIDVCLRELAVMMLHSKFIERSSGITIIWPDSIEWIDDDKGDIKININIRKRGPKKTTLKGKP